MYVQDDWRTNKWLTLNPGVRYNIYTAKTEQYNRLANFDPVSVKILVAGQNSSNTAGISTDHGNLAPRFGFAATLGHGMVLRGGFGLSFFQNDTTSAAALKNIPLTSALTCGTSTTGNYTNNNCPAGIGTLSQGVPRPLAASAFPVVNGALDLSAPPSTLNAVDTNFQASYNLQYNVTLEKQFGNNVVSVGYIGTKGRDLAMNLPDINRALPSGNATPNARPYAVTAPRVTTINYLTTHGSSSYNALQVSFNRRFNKGLTFTSGYNFGQGKDNVTGLGTSTGGYGNLIGPFAGAIANSQKYDWATSDFNIKHRFSFGGNYELPFGKSLKGAAEHALGGWQVNGSVTWQTRLSFTVTDQTAVSGIIGVGGNTEHPNLVSNNIRVSTPTVGVGGQFLDAAAFALPTAFTLGNSPRNVGVGPNQSIINASLFKTFKLYEGWNLQFRTEMFTVPNHPIFGQPNVNFGNANFGKITSTGGVYALRQIQFALKLQFQITLRCVGSPRVSKSRLGVGCRCRKRIHPCACPPSQSGY